MQKSVYQWFDEYAESHQHKTNKKIHWVCVPLIYFSIICLLMSLRFDYHIILVSIIISQVIWFYFTLSRKIAMGMLLFTVLCLLGARWLSMLAFPLWGTALIIFALAWVGQFYGHKLEGKKPSFLKDLQFLLIGPAWLLSFIYQKYGIKY